MNPLLTKNVMGELTLRDVFDSVVNKAYSIYVDSQMKIGSGQHRTFGHYFFADCHFDKEYLLIGDDLKIKLNSKVKVYPTHIEIIIVNAKIRIEFMESKLINLDNFLPRR